MNNLATSIMTYKTIRQLLATGNIPYNYKSSLAIGAMLAACAAVNETIEGQYEILKAWDIEPKSPAGRVVSAVNLLTLVTSFCFVGKMGIEALDEFTNYMQTLIKDIKLKQKAFIPFLSSELLPFIIAGSCSAAMAGLDIALDQLFYSDTLTEEFNQEASDSFSPFTNMFAFIVATQATIIGISSTLPIASWIINKLVENATRLCTYLPSLESCKGWVKNTCSDDDYTKKSLPELDIEENAEEFLNLVKIVPPKKSYGYT